MIKPKRTLKSLIVYSFLYVSTRRGSSPSSLWVLDLSTLLQPFKHLLQFYVSVQLALSSFILCLSKQNIKESNNSNL